MTADERIRVLRMIADDCLADTQRRDGMALTGENVATAMGEMCAQIAALADVLIDMNLIPRN